MITVGQLGHMLALYGRRWRAARRGVLLRRFLAHRVVVRIPRGRTSDPSVDVQRLAAELKAIDAARPGRRFRDPRRCTAESQWRSQGRGPR